MEEKSKMEVVRYSALYARAHEELEGDGDPPDEGACRAQSHPCTRHSEGLMFLATGV